MMGSTQNCIICDTVAGFDCRYNIFKSFASHSGILLKNLLQDLMQNVSLPESMKHKESYACKECFALLEQFDYSTILLSGIKKQIQEHISAKYGINQFVQFVEVACQTEQYLQVINESLSENVEFLEDLNCKVCNESFSSLDALENHNRIHGFKDHKCLLCGNSFGSKSGLATHISRKHKNGPDDFIKKETVLEDVPVEIKESESQNQFLNEEILEPQISFEDDNFHDEPFHSDDAPEVDILPDRSRRKRGPKTNLSKSRRKIKSNEEDSDDDNKTLSQHKQDILDKPVIKLEKSWDSENNSDSENKLENSNEFKAKRRGRPKKQPDDFFASVRPHVFQCTQCPKKWRTKSELRIHVASHSSVRAHVCEICGQGYKKRSALDIHIGMHNGINPYTCTICGKVFTQKGALNRHLPIHTGQANYQCDLCGKRYIHHTSFSMHVLTHSGLKAFKCEICGLGLMSTSHLKRHMRAHSGEKKYACGHCGKKFAERYNLAAHERLHFGPTEKRVKRTHSCPVCLELFPRRQKLEEHLTNSHHKIMDNEDSKKWAANMFNSTGNLLHDNIINSNGEPPWTAFSHSETVFPMEIKPEHIENMTDSNEMHSS